MPTWDPRGTAKLGQEAQEEGEQGWLWLKGCSGGLGAQPSTNPGSAEGWENGPPTGPGVRCHQGRDCGAAAQHQKALLSLQGKVGVGGCTAS